MQNMDLLNLFQFFIDDFRQEVKNNKCLSPIRVYHAQQMSLIKTISENIFLR
jgi:hypothetical protein